jgi:hypothetical protein
MALATAVLVACGLAWSAGPGAATPGGHACGVYLNAPRLGIAPTVLADTGEPIADPGGQGADLHEADVPGILEGRALTATTSTDTGVATSATSIADVTLLPGHPAMLTAAFVRAQADVLDARGSGRWRGVTEIRDLTFAGRSVAVEGTPNQRIDLPGVATLVINEQVTSTQGGVPTLTVNALRLTLATGDQFVIASARSSLDKQSATASLPRRMDRGRADLRASAVLRGREVGGRPPVLLVHEQPECRDFVTGGGWFEPRFEGGPPDRINFGFNAGYRSDNGKLLGHVNVVDHNDGTHIEGVNVDTYARLGDVESLCRMFEGDATMDGNSGFRYHVEVCDYGEPGRDDRFRIMVFDAAGGEIYFADDSSSAKTCDAGEPRCGDLDGGNIQLHKNCDHQPASTTWTAPGSYPRT